MSHYPIDLISRAVDETVRTLSARDVKWPSADVQIKAATALVEKDVNRSLYDARVYRVPSSDGHHHLVPVYVTATNSALDRRTGATLSEVVAAECSCDHHGKVSEPYGPPSDPAYVTDDHVCSHIITAIALAKLDGLIFKA